MEFRYDRNEVIHSERSVDEVRRCVAVTKTRLCCTSETINNDSGIKITSTTSVVEMLAAR